LPVRQQGEQVNQHRTEMKFPAAAREAA